MIDRQLHSICTCLAFLLVSAAPVYGQDGVVRGRILDSAGVAIPDADVAIVSVHLLTRSDAAGRFTLSRLGRGQYEVSVRRLGFQPTTVKAVVGDLAYSYDIVMLPQAATLAGVDVSASERLRLGIEDFYRRRARGMGGAFFVRSEILARNAHRTTDVLRNTAGIRVVGRGVRFTGSGSAPRGCIPTLWLDGQPVDGMEVDNVAVTDIEGMEVYSGPSETPMQFSHRVSHLDCGTIVIWTRIPGTS
jgi:hypothetical protein